MTNKQTICLVIGIAILGYILTVITPTPPKSIYHTCQVQGMSNGSVYTYNQC